MGSGCGSVGTVVAASRPEVRGLNLVIAQILLFLL